MLGPEEEEEEDDERGESFERLDSDFSPSLLAAFELAAEPHDGVGDGDDL